MKEQLGYKYRFYPNATQELLFRRTVGCCRLVYNLCLEQRSMADRHRLSAYDQIKKLPRLKAEVPFLKEVPNHCLQQAVIDLDRAFKKRLIPLAQATQHIVQSESALSRYYRHLDVLPESQGRRKGLC